MMRGLLEGIQIIEVDVAGVHVFVPFEGPVLGATCLGVVVGWVIRSVRARF